MGATDVVDLQTVLEVARARGVRLGAEVAGAVTVQVCDALASMHADGIAHGALRPEHVLIAANGVVTVVGLGRFELPAGFDDDPERPASTALVRQVRYIAPEQIRRDGGLQPGSDVWSAAIVASELIAGVHPIAAELDDAVDVMRAVLTGVEPSDVWPPVLREVLRLAHAPEHARRPSPAALRNALIGAAAALGLDLGPAVIARGLAALGLPAPAAAPDVSAVAEVAAAAGGERGDRGRAPMRVQAAGKWAAGGPRCWCVHLAAGLPFDVDVDALTAYVRDGLEHAGPMFSTAEHYGDVGLRRCARCGGAVLHLLVEHEGFTGSIHSYYTPLTERDCEDLVSGVLDGASYEAWAGDRCGIHVVGGRPTIYRRAQIGYLGLDHRLLA